MTDNPYTTHLSSGAMPRFMNLSFPNFFSVSISFDSSFSFALHIYPPLTPDAFSFPTLIISTLHTPQSIFSYRSHIFPWHHYQLTSRPIPLSLRFPSPTLRSRDARSLLRRLRPTCTGCTRSTETLNHHPMRLCRLGSTRFRITELQVTSPDRMGKAGECFIWIENPYLTHRPSLLPRDGGINGSGLSPVGAALLALGGVAAVGVAGLLVHSKFDDSRDRKKAALTQRQRGEAQEPTEPDPRASTRSRIRSAKESLSAICHTNRSKSAPRTEPVSQPHPEIELDIMAPPHIHGRSERLP